jgi:hypothetical protein
LNDSISVSNDLLVSTLVSLTGLSPKNVSVNVYNSTCGGTYDVALTLATFSENTSYLLSTLKNSSDALSTGLSSTISSLVSHAVNTSWCSYPTTTNNYRASNISQTTDLDIDYDTVSTNVSFARARNEGSGVASVVGYLLYIGLKDNRYTLVANKTVSALGGSAGQVVTTPFVLTNRTLSGNTDFFVAAYTSDAIAYVHNHATTSILDRAVPLSVATAVIATPDTNLDSGHISLQVYFNRSSSENDGTNREVVGYKVYLASSVQAGLFTRGQLLVTSVIGTLGGLSGSKVEIPFDIASASTSSMKAIVVVSYNDVGDCRLGAPIALVDLSRPAVVASNVTFTQDLDSRLGFVTFNISFTRAINESNVVGYKLYLLNVRARVQLLGAKSNFFLGGYSGLLVQSGFVLRNENIQSGTNQIAIVAYNDGGDALESFISTIPDFYVPDDATTTCTFVDEDSEPGYIGGTLNITTTENITSVVSYSVYLGGGGTSQGDKVSDILLSVAPNPSSNTSVQIPYQTQLEVAGTQSILIFLSNENGDSALGYSCVFTDLTGQVPTNSAAAVRLVQDEDLFPNILKGIVNIGRAEDESDIVEYRVYLASDASGLANSSVKLLATAAKTGSNINVSIISTVDNAIRLLVLAANSYGEASSGVVGLFTDRTGTPPMYSPTGIVQRLDLDHKASQIAGQIEISKALIESDIDEYVIFIGAYDSKGGIQVSSVEPLLRVPKGVDATTSILIQLPRIVFTIETLIVVMSSNSDGVQFLNPTSTAIIDLIGENVQVTNTGMIALNGENTLSLGVKVGPAWPLSCQEAMDQGYESQNGTQLDGGYFIANGTGEPYMVYCVMTVGNGGWQLVGNVPGVGGWFSGSTNSSSVAAFSRNVASNPNRYTAYAWNHNQEYFVPFRVDTTEIMFMTGDESTICSFMISDLQSVKVTFTANTLVIASNNTTVSAGQFTNVYNDGVTSSHPFVGCEGSFLANQLEMLWAEGDSMSYTSFKNAHGGVGVFVR